jgi:hypothetical protein
LLQLIDVAPEWQGPAADGHKDKHRFTDGALALVFANRYAQELRLAFTRRTLDWLSTSLLNGMSREGDSVIFWTSVICTLHDGPPGDSLLASNPT